MSLEVMTMNEIELTSGAGPFGNAMTNYGNDLMVTGGSIAAIGMLTPGIPDLEPVGAAVFLTGAGYYGIGRFSNFMGW